MAKSDRPQRPVVLDGSYAEAQSCLQTAEIMRDALQTEFLELSGKPLFLRVSGRTGSPEMQQATIAARVARILGGLDLGLEDWTALIELQQQAVRTATFALAVLDGATEEQASGWFTAGLLPSVLDQGRLITARLSRILLHFVASCPPETQGLGRSRIEALEYNGSGVVLTRDRNGARDIQPYVGTRMQFACAS